MCNFKQVNKIRTFEMGSTKITNETANRDTEWKGKRGIIIFFPHAPLRCPAVAPGGRRLTTPAERRGVPSSSSVLLLPAVFRTTQQAPAATFAVWSDRSRCGRKERRT